ncbi:MAG TPA: sensor histidine kinase [Croceibacterium sp.]
MERTSAVRRIILADMPWLTALGWSALAVGAPTALRWALDRGEAGIPFVSYFPAVTLVALFLGWRWAVGVALASGMIANRVFRDEPILFYLSARDAALVAMFVLACAALIWIGEVARRTVRELEAAKAREGLLNDELMHRMKNMLATVNAMAVLTARHSDPERFVQALTGRMQALERATGLLGVGQAAHCDVHALVTAAVAPFRAEDNFTLAGPPCELPREACVPLSLALHELCTNAAKYGALSVPEGQVELVWTIGEGEDRLLRLAWRESGGPQVEKPQRAGMGTQLLRRQAGLKAVAIDYPPAGVSCLIEVEGVGAAATTGPGSTA